MTKFIKIQLAVLILVAYSFCADLSTAQKSKLHPLFQMALTGQNSQQKKVSDNKVLATSFSALKNEIVYDAIIYTDAVSKLKDMGITVNSVYPEFVTAQVTLNELKQLSSLDCVRYIDPGSKNYPQLEVSVPEIGASLLHAGFINNTQYKGNGVIVLIYDTGIDWKHLDFRKSDTTKSRILCIWDQSLTAMGGENPPAGFSYGVEYTQTQIENELDGTPAGFVRERDYNGHGTHVAGIAAGNGQSYNNKYVGVAPEADIIVVKGSDGSFTENRMIDGLTYAANKASFYGKPIVVNWSIGGHTGPHDGTKGYEKAINSFVKTAGRAVCVSAGNSGGDNIHISGSVSSSLADSVLFIVPSYTPNSGSGNDYFIIDIWTRDADQITATLISPTNLTWNLPPNTLINGVSSNDGTVTAYNYIMSVNGKREIYVWIEDSNPAYPPKAGTWKIRLTKSSGGTTNFDGWLTESDLGGYAGSLVNGNTDKTVCMPGTADSAITVGAYVTKRFWPSYAGGTYYYPDNTENDIAPFSSIGPTADGRLKPEISAPGAVIASALSQDADTTGTYPFVLHGRRHCIMQGTSMASPHVAGICALLLQANPNSNAIQIRDFLTSTANVDSYTGSVPNYIWGYGKADVLEAMAKNISSSAVVSRSILSYDGTGSDSYVVLDKNHKYALRFTPTSSGKLTGFQLRTYHQAIRWLSGNGPLKCEVYTDNGGFPGTQIGSTVYHSFSLLTPSTNNYIQMLDANVEVSAGTDYHIVLSQTNPDDSLAIMVEYPITGGERSSYYNGIQWYHQTIYNLRIRPIVTTVSGMVYVDDGSTSSAIKSFRLSQNYPNPFNPHTTIRYELPCKARVKLEVYDVLGRLVSTLVDLEQEMGSYEVKWDGKSDDGLALASGIYFYRLNALPYNKERSRFTKTERMLMLK